MIELKPCPFCGGEAELIESDYGMYQTGYAVYCNGECRVKMGVTGRLSEAYEWVPVFDTEAEAIEAWNTRAERTCYDTGECRWFCCSECGFGFNDMYANKEREYGVDVSFPKYCPNCGGKVKVEDA